MFFNIEEEQVDGVEVVHCHGTLTSAPSVAAIRDILKKLLDSHKPKILMDLIDVSRICNAGYHELFNAHFAARKQGRELRLLSMTEEVKHETYEVKKLFRVVGNEGYENYDSLNAAILDFSAPAVPCALPPKNNTLQSRL